MEEVVHKMEASTLDFVTWDDIDLAESYLVSGMFEEAAALASSILSHLYNHQNIYTKDKILWLEMMESSVMVLLQSRQGTGRISDLLNELKCYFGSVTEVPVQVVLTGACIQVSGGHPSGVRDFLDDFLAKWHFNNENYCVSLGQDVLKNEVVECTSHSTLEVDQYLKVVEFYALTLMGVTLNDVDHAISWVEKAQLPEEARQDLLRRLSSLHPRKSSSSTQGTVSSSTIEEPEPQALTVKEVKQSDKSLAFLRIHSGGLDSKRSIWIQLHNIIQRSCSSFIASKGKIFLACFFFLSCYFIQKKRQTIKSVVQKRASSMKKALVDFWKLAFSYQVNPLAAVQPLPASTNRIR